MERRFGLAILLAAGLSVATPDVVLNQTMNNPTGQIEPVETVIPRSTVSPATAEQVEDIMKIASEYLHPGYFINTTVSTRGNILFSSDYGLVDGILEFRRNDSVQIFRFSNFYSGSSLRESVISSTIAAPSSLILLGIQNKLSFLGSEPFDNDKFIRTEDNLKSLPRRVFQLLPVHPDWDDESFYNARISAKHRIYEARWIDEESKSLAMVVESVENEEFKSLLDMPPVVALRIKHNRGLVSRLA